MLLLYVYTVGLYILYFFCRVYERLLTQVDKSSMYPVELVLQRYMTQNISYEH